jgi:hypothetical protein
MCCTTPASIWMLPCGGSRLTTSWLVVRSCEGEGGAAEGAALVVVPDELLDCEEDEEKGEGEGASVLVVVAVRSVVEGWVQVLLGWVHVLLGSVQVFVGVHSGTGVGAGGGGGGGGGGGEPPPQAPSSCSM